MKHKLRLLVGCLLMAAVAWAQETKKEYVLLGPVTSDSLLHDTSCSWFSNPPAYTPNAAYLKLLTAEADKLFVKIYAGSWCEDTQRELPRFAQVAKTCGIRYSLFFVDRSKQSPDGETKRDSVLFIPTFILLKNDMELGRVVEMAPYGIEKHLADLLGK